MPRHMKPEIFIRTLTELWEEERQRNKARLRRELRESVSGFLAEVQARVRHGATSPGPAPARRVDAATGRAADPRRVTARR